MEGLLCSQNVAEIDELYNSAYNLESGLVLFPVRHHSPACSFHLKKVIKAYNPDIILIEGPSDTNPVLKFIEHEESQAPLCIYYCYSDKKGVIGEKDGKYMCYYPFLDYSPELVAIREARGRGITAEFIDLAYPEILANSSSTAAHEDTPKPSYNDDYLLQRGDYLKKLYESEGCRNFSELWEKLFELDGYVTDTSSFVKSILAFCYFSRLGYSKEMLQSDGCHARETYMAQNILKTCEKYDRVLVVTGGFHTSGLIDLIKTGASADLKSVDLKDSGTYAMAYSLEESDQLNGYASGMPYPAFYQRVWEQLLICESGAYDKAVLHFIIKCGNYLRKKEGGISTADEIEAYNMAKGLKLLRSKSGCGVFELIDAVRTSFVKGELNYYQRSAVEALLKLLTGKKIGRLCKNADVPPLLEDFREKAEYFRLKTDTTTEQELTLQIYKSKRHRECSKFLSMLSFMNIGFCRRVKGPDFRKRTNTNMVREVWKYRWSAQVDSGLIELSVYGGSLLEVAGELAKKKYAQIGNSAGEASLLMIELFMMGLDGSLQEIAGELSGIISNDGRFFSVADCTYNLSFLNRSGNMFSAGHNNELGKLISQAYNKTVTLIPSLSSVSKDDENKAISKLKDLCYISTIDYAGLDKELLEEALLNITGSKQCNSAIEGAAAGLLFGMGKLEREKVMSLAQAYLYGTGEKFLESAGFLKGLFSTARDIVFYDGIFLEGLDNVLRNLNEDAFIKILPELRLAFSFFNPGEIEEIGENVAAAYSADPADILRTKAVDPEDVSFCKEIDTFGTDILKQWRVTYERQ